LSNAVTLYQIEQGVHGVRKGLISKIGMFAMLVAAILTISATSVTGEASRVQWFTIQNNSACSSTAYTNMFFNVNNVSDNSTNVTVRLYNDAGIEITIPTRDSAGYPTGSISPGTTFSLAGKSTKHYIMVIGGGYTSYSCDDRPAFGKIVVESDSGLIMAGGEIKGARASDGLMFTHADIIVNGGKPF
jgi:hypothetical protein